MMNAVELTQYKLNLEQEVKNMQKGLDRLKLEVSSKKKMIELIDEQLNEMNNANTEKTEG
jgi:hypothetical protein